MAHSLVLTIAHRLKTILGQSKDFILLQFRFLVKLICRPRETDYDRILVLGDGHILEYDTPALLFAKPDGVFRSMCERSADWEELKGTMGEQIPKL